MQISIVNFRTSFYVVLTALFCALATIDTSEAQQVPDLEFNYPVKNPAFQVNEGPRIKIDKKHSPYVARGSFEPFMKLAGNDGFQPSYLESAITAEALSETDILVIVNAYKRNYRDFPLLQPPAAHEANEISILKDWVQNGGRLLLIADHAPFAGGTSALAESFGFIFINGYVVEKASIPFLNGKIDFKADKGINEKHPIIQMGSRDGKIKRFFTFTGSAFIPPDQAQVLLTIPKGYTALMTNSIRRDVSSVAQINVSGLPAGATLELGKGKIAVFAEAGSFTAQTVNKIKTMGINNQHGAENPLLILATLRWLAEGL